MSHRLHDPPYLLEAKQDTEQHDSGRQLLHTRNMGRFVRLKLRLCHCVRLNKDLVTYSPPGSCSPVSTLMQCSCPMNGAGTTEW